MRKQLSVKQKLFVKSYIDNKGNGTKAAREVYDVRNDSTANAIAVENLRKPLIQNALAEHENLFASVITNTVQDWSTEEDTAKRSLAVNTAKWGYEQIHGKATQRTESVSASFIQHTSTKAKEYGL